MRLLVLTTSYPLSRDDYSGIFIQNFLSSLPRKIANIAVVSPHGHGANKQERFGKIEVFRFRYWIPYSAERLSRKGGIMQALRTSIIAWFQLPSYFISAFILSYKKARQADLIHAHWIFSATIAALLNYFIKIPFVITFHGTDITMMKRSLIFRIMGKFALRRSFHVICVSQYLQQELRDIAPFIRSISVFPNGLGNAESFLAVQPSHKNKTIIWVGRFSEEKNVPFLLTVFSHICKTLHGTRLLCIGDGPLLEPMKKMAEVLGISGQVSFVGPVPPAQLATWYAQASLFLLSSKREGFGIVLIEAMASGLPVIAPFVGSIPEIVDNEKNGFLCDSEDTDSFTAKAVLLLTDQKLADKFGQNGKAKVRSGYNWEAIASDIVTSVYEKMHG